MYCSLCLSVFLFRPATALRLNQHGPDSLCFRRPPGDQIQKILDFIPDKNSSSFPDDPLAEAVQMSFAEKSELCDALYQIDMPLFGVGASISSLLKPLTETWKSHKLITAPSVYGYNWSTFGMKPLLSPACGDNPHIKQETAQEIARVMHIFPKIPEEFQEQGNFWWASQELAFLLRPDDEFASELEALKASFKWEVNRPILAMHVRHGDSCSKVQEAGKARNCEDLDVYMTHARKMIERYNYKSIFLATDDPGVFKEAVEKYPEITWLYRSGVEGYKLEGGMIFENGVKAGIVDYKKAVANYLIDLFMLADADGFLGKFTSNLGRLALSLHYGQKRCMYPFISMDSFWCSDFNEYNGINPFRKERFLC